MGKTKEERRQGRRRPVKKVQRGSGRRLPPGARRAAALYMKNFISDSLIVKGGRIPYTIYEEFLVL